MLKYIFKIKREERLTAFVALLAFVALNAMTVVRYWNVFSVQTTNYRSLFVKHFHVSGFDPLTYQVISEWFPAYNIYRHPLLAFFMWPLSMINKGLMALTGTNFAIVLTALVLIFCATYSVVFLFRILREVVGIGRRQANVLCLLYFSFSFIILSAMVPDHFVMSQFCLLLTLWIAGEKLGKGSALNMWQTIGLFILTAGVSLNNGLKIFLAALFTRGKRFFRPAYLLLAIILPACLIWAFARWEYATWEAPQYRARQAKKEQIHAQKVAKIKQDVIAEMPDADSAKIAAEVNKVIRQRAIAKYRHDHKQAWNVNKGKPFMKGEFMQWTDATTSRWDVGVENLFGESIMLHENYLLADVLVKRPVIVRYQNWFNYIVEAFLVTLFIIGVWCGRKSRFLWVAMSFFLMDMALHMGLGFGINEIYIMSPHYLFVIPIAIGYLIHNAECRIHNSRLTLALGLLALYLLIWNITLITEYLFIL
ncbi:MAG: GtrA family protein [Prevotella sp.]|nr:GtrA family protein [Prevotella sp.]